MAARIQLATLILFLGMTMTIEAQSTQQPPPDITPKMTPHPHPRLLMTDTQLDDLRRRIEADPLLKQIYESEKQASDALIDLPTLKYDKEGRRLLDVSREALLRITRLALLYRLSEDARYLERAQTELLAVAAFHDWNPSHYLDTAEMAMAVAIGYDWLHGALDEPTRRTLRQALIDKAIHTSFSKPGQGEAWWVTSDNNWNQVCHAGMAFAAIAVWEETPELAAKVVRRAVEKVPAHSMQAYSPDGVYPEGPMYWQYGTMFNVLMIEGLRSGLGSDFGIASFPGFRETAIYQHEVTGPTMEWFNYADCIAGGPQPSAVLMWFAKQYDRPDFAFLERRRLTRALKNGPLRERMLGALTLLWLDSTETPVQDVKMPLSWSGQSVNPVGAHRSGWHDEASYLAIKGGRPNVNHGQQDVGTFVFDADGARWAIDLGMEGYHGIESRGMNLWNMSQGSDRWRIFRQSAAAHNVVTIGDHPQAVNGMSPIASHLADGDFPHTVVNLTAIHDDRVKRHRRGAGLAENRRVGVVRDELDGVPAGQTLRWAMLTGAEVTIEGNTASLTQGTRTLTLTVVAPRDAKLSVVEVSTLTREWDSPNPGVRKLEVTFTPDADGRAIVAVELRPSSAGASPARPQAAIPLDEWPTP